MGVDRLLGRVREFASYLDGLLARLDRGGGWSGVFWQRDPEGMRACLDGREVPPWDVVESLLQDLGTAYGGAAAAAERERARTLHTAALAAYDARPGARDALAGRLDVMLREQRYAAERVAGLNDLLSAPASPDETASLHGDLAWARDDHHRLTARCAELSSRMERLDRRASVDRRGAHPAANESTLRPAAPSPSLHRAPGDPAPAATRPSRPAEPAPARAGWFGESAERGGVNSPRPAVEPPRRPARPTPGPAADPPVHADRAAPTTTAAAADPADDAAQSGHAGQGGPPGRGDRPPARRGSPRGRCG
ncbi:hypothetical protein ACWEN3_41115, partial [Streptomyces sp. NPDC004561]